MQAIPLNDSLARDFKYNNNGPQEMGFPGSAEWS